MKKGQPKKVKGAKSTAGTGKYKKMADQKNKLLLMLRNVGSKTLVTTLRQWQDMGKG